LLSGVSDPAPVSVALAVITFLGMSHPYNEFEDTALWKALDAALADLEQNRDVQLSTARDYVVGYLCQQLANKKLVADTSLSKE
jgi:hypothetical protein